MTELCRYESARGRNNLNNDDSKLDPVWKDKLLLFYYYLRIVGDENETIFKISHISILYRDIMKQSLLYCLSR